VAMDTIFGLAILTFSLQLLIRVHLTTIEEIKKSNLLEIENYEPQNIVEIGESNINSNTDSNENPSESL
jgi:hypothetical protein